MTTCTATHTRYAGHAFRDLAPFQVTSGPAKPEFNGINLNQSRPPLLPLEPYRMKPFALASEHLCFSQYLLHLAQSNDKFTTSEWHVARCMRVFGSTFGFKMRMVPALLF